MGGGRKGGGTTVWGVPLRDWPYALRDAGLQTLRDNVFGLAAGLTYFTVITLFPALVTFVSFLVLIGHADAVTSLVAVISDIGPSARAPTVTSPIHHVISHGASITALVSTAAFCFLAASGYVGTFAWMSRRLREEKAAGGFWRQRGRQSLVALAALGLLALIALALGLSPSLFANAGSAIGRAETGILVFRLLRWPVLFAAGLVLFNLLYSSSSTPPGHHRGWMTGGSVVAILCWLLATLIYDLYVRNVGQYSSFYGLFGYLLAFLLWLWMLNIAVLGGVELNLQLDRRRGHAEARGPAEARRAA